MLGDIFSQVGLVQVVAFFPTSGAVGYAAYKCRVSPSSAEWVGLSHLRTECSRWAGNYLFGSLREPQFMIYFPTPQWEASFSSAFGIFALPQIEDDKVRDLLVIPTWKWGVGIFLAEIKIFIQNVDR